jgi:PAS domain S-box-containing protein
MKQLLENAELEKPLFLFRSLLFFGITLVLLPVWFKNYLHPGITDPVWFRLTVSGIMAAILFGSFYALVVKKYFQQLVYSLNFILVVWLQVLLYINNFHSHYTGSIYILLSLSLVLYTKKASGVYILLFVISTLINISLVKQAPVNQTQLIFQLLLYAGFIYFVVISRYRHKQRLESAIREEKKLNEELTASEMLFEQTLADQKELLQRIGENEQQLKETQALVKLGYWSINDQTKKVYWSDEIYQQLGHPRYRLSPYGNAFKALLVKEDIPVVEEAIEKARNGEQVRFQYRIRPTNKHTRYIMSTVRPMFDDFMNIIGVFGSAMDITETELAKEEIRKLALVAEKTENGVVITDREGNIEWVNRSFEQITGYNINEVYGKKPGEFLQGPETDPATIERFGQALSQGRPYKCELVNYTKSGRKIFLSIECQPIKNERGDIERFIAIESDITKERLIQQRILDSEQAVREAQQLAGLGAWEYDPGQELILWSEELSQIFGMGTKGVGKHTLEYTLMFFNEISKSIFKKALRDTSQSGKKLELTLGILTRQQQHRWVRIVGKQKFNINGQLTVSGVVQDITVDKNSEQQMAQYRRGLETLNMIASRANLDYQNQIEHALEAVSDYLGLPIGIVAKVQDKMYEPAFVSSKIEAVCKPGQGPTPLEEVPCGDIILKKKAISRTSFGKVNRHPCHKKAQLTAHIGAPIYVKSELYGVVSFFTTGERKGEFTANDISFITLLGNWIGFTLERKDAEEQLVLAKEKAEKASLAKAQFLSTMSHEIRTPMNAVIGISHILLQENPRPEQVENLNALKFSAQNLLALINDILDFSKIESGKIELEAASFDVKDLLNGLQHSFSFKAQEKGIAFNIQHGNNLPALLVGDPTRLSQVLNNLVSNAVKFTDKGSVTLSLNILELLEEKITIQFEVTDTGIGIPEDKRESIFNAFIQANADTTRKYGGTGLGLSITKKLLEIMGSQIFIDSSPGKGTRFYFTLSFFIDKEKLKVKKPANNQTVNYDKLENTKVLLAEDNAMNVMVARKFLEKWGFTVEVAENGKIAVDKAKTTKYDLVLMDLQMPVLDGYEATKAIKASNKNLPIVALTASAVLEIQERVMSAGMDDFITKPFNPDELYRKITYQLKKGKTLLK